jgi:hypothetical protein
MLSARSIFQEIRADDRAYRLLLSVAAKGEMQGGWKNERIALLTPDRELAVKIRRHGEDEAKHGPAVHRSAEETRPDARRGAGDAHYCMLLEQQGIGLAHQRLRRDEPLADEDIIRYPVHSWVTEKRSTEEIGLQLRVFGDDPELGRALAIIADDEANHLSNCHEELLRLCAQGYRPLIERMLKRYAHAEIRVYRRVSLCFINEIAAILGWSPLKRGVLRLGARAVYLVERSWTWCLNQNRIGCIYPNDSLLMRSRIEAM